MPEDYSKGWIDLGEIDPKMFIRTVHELSSAQGLGFLADKGGTLTDAEMQPYLDGLAQNGKTRFDYLKGRSIKMGLHVHEGHYFIREGGVVRSR